MIPASGQDAYIHIYRFAQNHGIGRGVARKECRDLGIIFLKL